VQLILAAKSVCPVANGDSKLACRGETIYRCLRCVDEFEQHEAQIDTILAREEKVLASRAALWLYTGTAMRKSHLVDKPSISRVEIAETTYFDRQG
jgi:hypothetical protein